MFIGIFLILFGAMLLLDRLHVIDLKWGDFIVPIVLIAIGASELIKRQTKK